MNNRLTSRAGALFALALSALASACTDQGGGVTPPPVEPPPPAEAVGVLKCRASVLAGEVKCADASGIEGGASAALIVGGQNVFVRLTSSGTSYDPATQVLQSNVTVTNLMSQRLGSADGSTPTGIRVFFHRLPTVTAGTGSVSVANPDGTATFTGANQPYFQYTGMLEVRGTTDAKNWRFNVPTTVQSFEFTLYVVADVPFEQGVLRWTRVQGPAAGVATLSGVWAASKRDAWAITSLGGIMHWDGSSWIAQNPGTASVPGLWAVHGTSPTNVWAVGEAGTVLQYDGKGWFYRRGGSEETLMGVWAVSPTLMYAVGSGGVVLQNNSGSWTRTTITSMGAKWFEDVWASSASDVWAVGDSGTVMRFNGTSWTRDTSFPATAQTVTAIWGSGGVMYAGLAGGNIYRRNAGSTSWTLIGAVTAPLEDIHGTGPNLYYVVGNGQLLQMSTSSGSFIVPGGAPQLLGVSAAADSSAFAVGVGGIIFGNPSGTWDALSTVGTSAHTLYSVWAGGPSEAYAVGTGGRVRRWDGVSWSADSSVTKRRLRGVTGTGGTLWAVGDTGTIVRRTDGVWMPVASGVTTTLGAVWGAPGGQAFAVGQSGTILRWDGAAWTAMTSGTTQHLYGVHGTSATDVWAVGANGVVLRYDGASWTPAGTVPAGTTLLGVWARTSGDVYMTTNVPGSFYRWNGTSLVHEATPSSIGMYGIWGTPEGDVYAVGATGALMRRTAAGVWRNMRSTVPDHLYGVFGSSSTDIWAVGAGGVIVRGVR